MDGQNMNNLQFTNDPITLAFSLIGGLVPALIWLWFWLKEDKEEPEPTGLVMLTFLLGMVAVIVVLPIQKYLYTQFASQDTLVVLWAASEEILKFIVVAVIAFTSSYITKPVSYPIYCIAGALGFAALENALFLVHPVGLSDTTVSLLTGNLRFLGSTLLHATATGMVGLMLGLAFFQPRIIKFFSFVAGLVLAIGLHSVFNFFIMQNNGENFLQVFAFLWVVAIISMLVFEKLRRMGEPILLRNVRIREANGRLMI